MAEWHDKIAEDLRKANEPKNTREFNLHDELARGAIYRGGESEENYLTGYALGAILGFGLLVFLYILGLLIG